MTDTTQTRRPGPALGRRGFFGAALGTAAGAALLGAGGASPALAEETGDERTRGRYQATPHVETFYRVNRYEKTGG